MWVDDRGRLFGRWNLIDVAIVAVVLVLIPAAYASIRVFMTPTPAIIRVEPETVYAATPGQTVRVTGVDFRPYLRVTLDDLPVDREVTSPTSMILRLPELALGAFDLVLYDSAQEIQRLRHAIVAIERPKPVVTKPPLEGPRYVVEERTRLSVGGEPTTLTVVRDLVAETCSLYRSAWDYAGEAATRVWRTVASGPVPCE